MNEPQSENESTSENELDSETKWDSENKTTKFVDLLENKEGNELKFSIGKQTIHDINTLLIKNKIKVEAIKPLRSLEEYFLKITEN